MPHEPRLTRELRALLRAQRVATLGTLNDDGTPLVSMVPFALRTDEAGFVIHVSALAAHTGNLRQRPAVSVLVMQPEEMCIRDRDAARVQVVLVAVHTDGQLAGVLGGLHDAQARGAGCCNCLLYTSSR